jgi:TRAP-type C4-dicarboxylate transport system substrate-binding protein
MYLQNIFTAAAGLSTIVTHITETQATYSAHIVLMSAARFYALPLAHQEALLAAGRAVEEEADEYYQAWLDRSLPVLQGRVEIKSLNAAERQQWERLSLDAWEHLKGRFDPAMVKRILNDQDRQEFLRQLEERRLFE